VDNPTSQHATTAEHQTHEAQQRMLRVARLATMGELAAGIAHELNQPLAAITNYARASSRLLAAAQPDLPEIDAALEQIGSQALRAGDIIRRLRALVRSEDPLRAPVNVNQMILDIEPLLTSDARMHNASFYFDPATDLPLANLDAVPIQHVLLNLAHNAFEAMDEVPSPANGRVLTLATQLGADRRIEVSCADSGPGLSVEATQRLFEPFFTTKWNGTGLGLATSRSILKAHGSELYYRPNRPQGACFYFWLPVIEEPPA
jgi:two-component system sensor kinase FixL